MAINPAPIRKTLLVLLCLLALQVCATLFGKRYWLNLTSSEPLGVYRIERLERGVQRGDLVIMNVPERFKQYVYGRRWLPDGWPLLKHVGAIPGDLFCLTDSSLQINGVLIGPVYPVDSESLPLPRVEGCRQVAEGYFLPVATGLKHSFDGRYMGPVSLLEIRGLARPIWVLKAE
jgi:conjugative transfer signal peptidase TraF